MVWAGSLNGGGRNSYVILVGMSHHTPSFADLGETACEIHN